MPKDYSRTFAILAKLRIRADFGEYSQAPRLPEKERICEYLNEAKELFKETESMIKALKK